MEFKHSLIILVVMFVGASADSCYVSERSERYEGDATHYDWADQAAAGRGSCLYDTGGDLNVAAVNIEQYDTGKRCGMCVEITGPDGDKLIVTIVDACMTCHHGDLDLSLDGFKAISGGRKGVAKISWVAVECPVKKDKPLSYVFVFANENANAAFQMRVFHSRHVIETLERFHEFDGEDAEWFTLPRASHGNWGVPKGYRNLDTPFRMRMTSNYTGEVLEEQVEVLPVNDDEGGHIIPANVQFASICAGSAVTTTTTYMAILCMATSLIANVNEFI